FLDPSPKYRPKFRYWLPDASVSPGIVTKDIHDAKAVGAGGLEYLPFYLYGLVGNATPPTDWTKYGFGTPAFNSLLKSSLKAAKDTGILIDYALGANQGQGVPSEVMTPGLSVELLMGNTTITPYGGISAPVPQPHQPSSSITSGLTFMHPLEQFGTPNLTAVIAYQVLSQTPVSSTTGSRTVYLNQSSFIDLMPYVQDGWALVWNPPDHTKTYKILSFWEAYTNQRSCAGGVNATDFIGNGSWTVDHFSKAGAARVTDFWNQYILSDKEISSLLKSVGKYAWEDSMEQLASLYWSPGLLQRFQNTYGYDLLPYLPLFFTPSNTWNGALPVYNEVFAFGNDTNVGNSVYQLDYRKVLNDGYQDYLLHFEQWTHSIGTEYSTQPAYNLPLQMLSDILLLDAPEGESLGFGRLTDAYRQFAGPAHLANKSVISTELGAVNVPPYSLRVPDLLQQIKRSFAGGFTMNVLHGFPTSTPYPNTTWPGYTTFYYAFTEMWNSIQPAWQHMRDTLDYVGRNQFVLQQGSPRVDLAFYLYASPWAPKTQYNSTNLRDLGYTYDYLGPDNLISHQATVRDGNLGIPGYQALIFNHQTVSTVETAESLVNMASSGLRMIFVGQIPDQTYPTTASSQAALITAVKRLLSNENVYQTATIDQLPTILAKLRIAPRTSLSCSSNPVYSIWRSSNDLNYIYFFNDQAKTTQCTAKISVAAFTATPYIYNAWTGSQTPLLQYTATNSTISVPLALKSNETLILALHRSPPSPFLKCTHNHTLALVTGPTTLTSSSGMTSRINASLPQATNLTTWDLVIEDWHSAPNRFAVKTEITRHSFKNVALVPWNQISASLIPVSGIGHYTTKFTVPTSPNLPPSSPSPSSSNSSSGLVGLLHLPLIQHTARVYLNGKVLPPIDPVNPVVEMTGMEAGKEYELEIMVTTTLFNRIKAEANETMVVGQKAAVLQPKYGTWLFEEYGLVGSVVVVW
ncbi:uncharacterized protein BDR25DRAFT_157719, partial [Lindgomyces ingoldianus]